MHGYLLTAFSCKIPQLKPVQKCARLNKVYGKHCGKCESSSQRRCVGVCMCVCTWLEQSRAPTGVPLLHLLCEYSLGGGGKVWCDLADQCWKSCPHAALVTHSQLLLTGLEDARIPGCSLACSTDKVWLLLCWVGDFPIPCPVLRCSAKLALLFLSTQPTPDCIHTQPPAIHPACRKHSLGTAIITQPDRNHPPTPLPSQQNGRQFLATELADYFNFCI